MRAAEDNLESVHCRDLTTAPDDVCPSEIYIAIFHGVYHYFIYRQCGVMHLFCFNFSDIKMCTPVLLVEFYMYGLSLSFKDVVCGKLSHIAGH